MRKPFDTTATDPSRTAFAELSPAAATAEERRARASAWFRALRDRIVAAFEALEAEFAKDSPPKRFEVRKTRREGGGSGLMSILRDGVVFEKAGINVSTVFGTLSPRAQSAMAARGVPGLAEDPRFWASGISLVAHMRNPRVPAVHLNTRMFWTPRASWFGGGTDLNPAIEFPEDTAHFHEVLRQTCALHGADYYERFKKWADEYFFIPHRGRPRGVGGIFFDDLDTGDWEADFAFTRAVGEAFLPAFEPIVRRRQGESFTEAEREAQLIHRGLYAEFNLVYDRGTRFGLETGHDPEAVLMSLPPLARWP